MTEVSGRLASPVSGAVSELYAQILLPRRAAPDFSPDAFATVYKAVEDEFQGHKLTPLKHLLGAYDTVPREKFLDERLQPFAKADTALPVWCPREFTKTAQHAMQALNENSEGSDKMPLELLLSGCKGEPINTSQPTTIMILLALANINPDSTISPGSTVLEIGSGCGYVVALLSQLAGRQGRVYGIEKNVELAEFSKSRLNEVAAVNASIDVGDALKGLPGTQPFDAIIASAAMKYEVAEHFAGRLTVGGRMVAPIKMQIVVARSSTEIIAEMHTVLTVITKLEAGYTYQGLQSREVSFTRLS